MALSDLDGQTVRLSVEIANLANLAQQLQARVKELEAELASKAKPVGKKPK